jgi:hypothetical protein
MNTLIDTIATSKNEAHDLVCDYISKIKNISIKDADHCLYDGILNDGGDVFEIKLKTKSRMKSIYYTYCDWLL